MENGHLHELALSHGYRILALDRSGMGKPDYSKNFTWLDYPDNIVGLTDSLDLIKIGII
ncbi:MAG: hypothetical protein GF311_18750 [Candidatus Lokiarchaeota archaeon]|nr:hypothetical protein [Candidatus Lokiarchaeota archaeon]